MTTIGQNEFIIGELVRYLNAAQREIDKSLEIVSDNIDNERLISAKSNINKRIELIDKLLHIKRKSVDPEEK